VCYGDVPVVKALLAAGVSPNATFERNDHYITLAGFSLIVRKVNGVESYFGPTATDIFGVIEAFLRAGFDVNTAINDSGDTLLIDATKRSPETVRFLLAHGADVGAVNRRGETALHTAAGGRDMKMVSLLIDAGADVNKPAGNRNTPLLTALQEGADNVAQLLIESGGNATPETSAGESALMFVTTSTMTTFLYRAGANINADSLIGENPLMRAASWGGSEVVKRLLELGADVSAVTDLGEAALHYALKNPHRRSCLEVVGCLINGGADVNAQTNDSLTALTLAVGNYIETLLDDWDDWTPLSGYDPICANLGGKELKNI
jgi:ankyrin repeat protein